MDGDLRPDWLVTSTCNDVSVGSSQWLYYANGPKGFAQAATPFALPAGAPTGAFTSTSRAQKNCAGNLPAFAFVDLTGDLVPDIVMPDVCDDSSIGATAWRIYPGTKSGVMPAAARFALPTATSFTLTWLYGALACTSGSVPSFGLADMNGDAKLDLVVTQSCADVNVGTTHWLVYPNSGSAFAASAAAFTLPTLLGAPTNPFPAFAETSSCGAGKTQPSYTLVDANGDLRLDLLLTQDCADPATGQSYFKLFAGDGARFASTPQDLTLPTQLGSRGAGVGLASAKSCTTPVHPAFESMYFPRMFALVVTSDCNDVTVGQSRWMVYPATCPAP